jgi:hypothetical protein
MFRTFTLPAMALLLFVWLPGIAESTISPCDALERLAIRHGAALYVRRTPLQGVPVGRAIRQFVDDAVSGQVPSLPPRVSFPDPEQGLTCSWVYWKGALRPEGLVPDLTTVRW